MNPAEEIKRIIIEYTRNGNILSDDNFLKVKELISIISDSDKFTIMSIATILYNHYSVKEDINNKNNICFYYCVTKPTQCAELINKGYISNMDEFFINVRRYCLQLVKEEY